MERTRLERMFNDNNNNWYREDKILSYNEVLERKVSEVESTDKVR